MAPSEQYVFCVPPRCAFCRFRLDGDDIIGMSKTGKVLGEKVQTDRGGIADVLYKPCSSECRHSDGEGFGCHRECLEMVPFELRPAAMGITPYRYEPSGVEDQRRVRWLQRKWSTILYTTFQRRLPLELCSIITAQSSLRAFAVGRALALLEKPQPSTTSLVGLWTKVWVQYTYFEGVRYLQSLTNDQPPDDSPAVELAYDSNSLDIMFVAEDHLGVRDLVFASATEKPVVDEQSNVWWRTVAILGLDTELEVKTSGGRLRSLRYLDEPTKPKARKPVYWPTPQFPGQLWYDSRRTVFDFGPMRMSALKCNDPGVTGYSVCCTLDVVAMHAHFPGEDVGEFYRQNDGFYAVWQYMPVDEGETVAEIWRRWDRRFPIQSLVFKTDKGRTASMGAWPIRYKRDWIVLNRSRWCLLNRPSKEPSRVYYETGIRGGPFVTQIATSCPAETDTVTWFKLPCRGQLEWWFSYKQCRVYHKRRASPGTSDIYEVSRHEPVICRMSSSLRETVIRESQGLPNRAVEVEKMARRMWEQYWHSQT